MRRPFLRKLALSAAQSILFNHYLAGAWPTDCCGASCAGDVMAKWPFGGMFVAEDVAREQARFDARETVTAGPMFGRKMFPAAAEAAAREAAVLAGRRADAGGVPRLRQASAGTRRHNLIYLDDLTAVREPEGVRLTFTLPAGSYATVLLREVMKVDRPDAEGGE